MHSCVATAKQLRERATVLRNTPINYFVFLSVGSLVPVL